MNSPTYRIKPLVWRPWGEGFVAYSLTGDRYFVYQMKRGWVHARCDRYMKPINKRSLEAAKAACEAHYRERLMEALEVVE